MNLSLLPTKACYHTCFVFKEYFLFRSDTSAQARTTTLNEELGQIQYVFR